MKATIIEQLLSKGIEMSEMKKFEALVRYYRNNDWQSDYSFTEIHSITEISEGWIILIEDYTNQSSCTVYNSNLFLLAKKEGKIINASRRVFAGSRWKKNLKWNITSISKKKGVFIVEGEPFGKEVIEKNQAFFPGCPLRDEWEEFFRDGGG